MEYSLELIAKHYATMSDHELEMIITQRAHGLRPEVYEIIEKEIEKRGLKPNLLLGAAAQNIEPSEEELAGYIACVSHLPCPVCGNNVDQLNAAPYYKYGGVAHLHLGSQGDFIACRPCLEKKLKDAQIFTALLGWWLIPIGFLRTPFLLYRNYKTQKQLSIFNRIIFENFVRQNIGQVTVYRNEPEKLMPILKVWNDAN